MFFISSFLGKCLPSLVFPRLACFINIWVSPEVVLCTKTLFNTAEHDYTHIRTRMHTHKPKVCLHLKDVFNDLLTAVGSVLWSWQMVCFFEVIKWMEKDRRLWEKTSIFDLVHTGGGTSHFDHPFGTCGSQLASTLSSESVLLCCWSWWWAYPGRCVCCTEPPLYAARCRCPLHGRVLGSCKCASAGSARHRRVPCTVTMTTSKTRHLSLNRPDTHIHDTHKYRTMRQAGRQKQQDVDKQTPIQCKQDAKSEHTEMQTNRHEKSRQPNTSKTKHNVGRNQKQSQCWLTTFDIWLWGGMGRQARQRSHMSAFAAQHPSLAFYSTVHTFASLAKH